MSLFQCFPPHTESEEEIGHGNKNSQETAYISFLARCITKPSLLVMDEKYNFPLPETKRELDVGENEWGFPLL